MKMDGKVNAAKMLRNLFFGAGIIFILVIVFNILIFSKNQNIENDSLRKQNNDSLLTQHSLNYAVDLPDTIYFAGERVPLDNFDVRESLDKEMLKVTFWHSEMFLYLKRANRYFPIIEPILKANGVPDDFKYICVTESGLTDAVSPAGAEGFWQFMKGTAKEYGLEVNEEVDERYNIKKATQAACKYLKNKYMKFGTWTVAAASYNSGSGGIDEHIDYQKEKSYYDLALFTETSRYVFRALAIKMVMQNPKKYGFAYKESDLYPVIELQEIQVDSAITDMISFSRKFETNYKLFKMFNPWLRGHKLTNKSKKHYTMLIPEKGARTKEYYTSENNK
jgi:membrane-bound lytic murein transglycosylase D